MHSSILKILAVRPCLPEASRRLFDELFQRGLSEEQIAAERGVPVAVVHSQAAELMRSLRAASARPPAVAAAGEPVPA